MELPKPEAFVNGRRRRTSMCFAPAPTARERNSHSTTNASSRVLTPARTSNSKQETRSLYRRLSTLWFALAFLNLAILEAQQEAPASDAGPKLSVTPPAQLNGSSPLLVPTGAAPRKNELLGGLGVGTVYDDSIAIINGRPQEGCI